TMPTPNPTVARFAALMASELARAPSAVHWSFGQPSSAVFFCDMARRPSTLPTPSPTTPKPIATSAGARFGPFGSFVEGAASTEETGAVTGEAVAFSKTGTVTVLLSDFAATATDCFQATLP